MNKQVNENVTESGRNFLLALYCTKLDTVSEFSVYYIPNVLWRIQDFPDEEGETPALEFGVKPII